MIGFGTLTDYTCYEMSEIENSFSFYDKGFRFACPEDIKNSFSIPQIEQLENLLRLYVSNIGVKPVLDKIVVGLQQEMQKTNYDKQILTVFNKFNKSQQEFIREYFLELFNTGMYMRRWGGPGTPYPLEKKTTETKVEPDKKTLEGLGRMGDILLKFNGSMNNFLTGQPKSDSWSGGLNIVEFTGKNFNQQNRSIGEILYQVVRGSLCIRMASSIFIGTAYYYLRLFFREQISNFDPTKVDHIS